MNDQLIRDCFGWVAAVAFASSYVCKTQTVLRRVQAVAALLWVGYGVFSGAPPVIVTNLAVAFMAVVYPWLRRRWEAPVPPTHEPAKQSLASQDLHPA